MIQTNRKFRAHLANKGNPLSLGLTVALALAALLGNSLPARAELDPEIAALAKFETRGNAAGLRSAEKIAIEHFEIPLSALESDVASRIPPDVRDSLIFEKDGQKFVRWIINPEDTKWHLELEKWLKSKGLSTQRHKHFSAYMTASRSYLLEDPKNGAQFSAKVSTNLTGGAWRDKKQPIDDARQVRMAADYIRDNLAEKPMQLATVMDEPAMFGVADIDQAMLIRTLDGIKDEPKFYLPGFSALHDRVGALIAKKNGSSNPAAFWNEHYNKPLGRSLAEFTARFGLCFDSPHSQNFLVELDKDLKPTGKIIIRDFGDSYATAEFLLAQGRLEFLKKWESDNLLKGRIPMAIGVLHGNDMPSWMNEQKYRQWGIDFFKEYEAELSKQTGVPLAELKSDLHQSGRYFSKEYGVKSAAWTKHFQELKRATPKGPAAAVAAVEHSKAGAAALAQVDIDHLVGMSLPNGGGCIGRFGVLAR